MTVSAEGGGVSLSETMQFLAGRGITRLLVEGGATVWRHFAEAGLVDEAVVFRAGMPQDAQAPTAASLAQVLSRFLPKAAMTLAATRRIGDDHMHIFRRI
jgi:diaminohydroxyphosphoribosylaminopyrimidine deaminase/5-amino-6-(5-phosphoribosylamino)uracil reductase